MSEGWQATRDADVMVEDYIRVEISTCPTVLILRGVRDCVRVVGKDHDQNCERTECQGEFTPTPEVDTMPLFFGKTYYHVSVGRFSTSWVF